MEKVDYIEIYNFYLPDKIKNYDKKKNVQIDCPFCEAIDKFTISVSTGKAQCFSCEESCNSTSFLTKFHSAWLQETPDSYYRELSKARGISIHTLKQAKLAYDGYKGLWLIPYKNPFSPQLSNLGVCTEVGENAFRIYKCVNSSGLFGLTFYNPFQPINKPPKDSPLIICEGEWDALAMLDIIHKSDDWSKDNPKPCVLAVPGASIIPRKIDKYIESFNKIYLSYDFDDPGQKGQSKMALYLQEHSKEVYRLDWSSFDVPEETDIRDMLTKHSEKAPVYSYFSFQECDGEAAQEEERSDGYVLSLDEIEPIDSVTEFFKQYEEFMYLTDTNRAAIIAALGIATSQYLIGEPLWAFFIGQASSGKTTLIESFGGENELFDYTSKITAKALVSGWSQGADKSFLRTANGKTLLIKDFTTVLGMDKAQQKELYDIFRDAYDGSFRQRFGNSVERNYQRLNFNIIAGVTPAIYKHNDADMGERFIRIDYMGRDFDVDTILDCVFDGYGHFSEKKNKLTEATLGIVKYINNFRWDFSKGVIRINNDDRIFIRSLSKFVARIRTKPEFDRTEGLKYRPQDEIPARIQSQLHKLTYAVEKVLRPTLEYDLDDNIELHPITRMVLAKVAHDTAYSFTREIIDMLYDHRWSSQSDIAAKLRLDQTRVQRTLVNMATTKLIVTKFASTGRGRPNVLYAPSNDMMPILDETHFTPDHNISHLLKDL